MFNPSREQARQFFFDTFARYRNGNPLSGLEQTALEVLLLHPEYHSMLDDPDRHLDRDYTPKTGGLNPFLHLSLHLAVAEQLSIDQPRGIRAAFEALQEDLGSQHDALHAILECLGDTLWRAQRQGTAPDQDAYLDCLRSRQK